MPKTLGLRYLSHQICCAQHPGIGHVIDGSTAYSLPRKPEGQPHTYNTDRLTLCLTYRLTYVSTASRMRIITETRPIRNRCDIDSNHGDRMPRACEFL